MGVATTRRITVTFPPVPAVLHPNGRTRRIGYRAAMFAKTKHDAYIATRAALGRWVPAADCITAVTITRRFYVPVRRARDIDNMEASTKAIADGTAAALNCNDRIFRWLPSDVVVERGRRAVMFDIELEVG